MHHAYMYNGAFEINYPHLRPGAKTYLSTEGEVRSLPVFSDKINGVRVGYMEKAGKKFFAVRVQYDNYDIVLENPVALDKYVCEIEEQPPKVVGTVESAENPWTLVLPIGRPYTDLAGDDEFIRADEA